jgi:hypothetical protein
VRLSPSSAARAGAGASPPLYTLTSCARTPRRYALLIRGNGQVMFRSLADPRAPVTLWASGVPAQAGTPFAASLRSGGSLVASGSGAAAPFWSSQSDCLGAGPFLLKVCTLACASVYGGGGGRGGGVLLWGCHAACKPPPGPGRALAPLLPPLKQGAPPPPCVLARPPGRRS